LEEAEQSLTPTSRTIKTKMPTVKEMMDHLFSSDEEEENDQLEEYLPVKKKGRWVACTRILVDQSCATNQSSHGMVGSVGSVGSEEVSTSQSSKSAFYDSDHSSRSSDTSNLVQPRKINGCPLKASGAPAPPIPRGQDDMPVKKKGPWVASPKTLVNQSIPTNKSSHGIVGSVGSDEVSTSQSSKSALYDSDHSSSDNSVQAGRTNRSSWKTPGPPIPMVQEDMDPTPGAVAALTTGANSSNGDINAIFDDGKIECFAGQVIMEDDVEGNSRSQMGWEEYYPILQVKRIVWHSGLSKENSRGVPKMVFYVTDGLDEMPMIASTRKHCLLANFWDKKGPYEMGVLRHGKIFKLLDYHTGLKMDVDIGKMVPCIFVEKVKPQPKRNMKKFRTIRAFTKEQIFK
jgi:hypothetical protein